MELTLHSATILRRRSLAHRTLCFPVEACGLWLDWYSQLLMITQKMSSIAELRLAPMARCFIAGLFVRSRNSVQEFAKHQARELIVVLLELQQLRQGFAVS